MADTIHEVCSQVLEDIIPYKKTVTIKQPYIDEELWSQIESRQLKWKCILTHANAGHNKARPVNVRAVFQAYAMFVRWRKEKRQVQNRVKQAKRNYLDKMIAESEHAGEHHDSKLKYSIINKLAPRNKGQRQAVKMSDGKYAHTADQETRTYDEMVKTIWNGKRVPNDYNIQTAEPNNQKGKIPLDIEATTADVRSAFRRCKNNKAMCKDTRPAELLHIADDVIAPSELALWQGIARARRIPNRWAISDVILIPKAGKDPSEILNRRGINKIDSGLKAFSTYVQSQTAPLVQKDAEGEWGGLQQKSIKQPLLITDIMIHRSKHAKMDLALFAGDIHKAFDCADHEQLAQALPRFIDHPVWPCIIEDRHSCIMFRFTLTDGTEVVYRIEQGAVQGCSLGPLAFNVYYRAFLRHLASMRQPYQHRIMHFRVNGDDLHNLCDSGPEGKDGHSIAAALVDDRPKIVSMHSLAFVDDHLEMWAVRNAREIREIFKPFIETQQHYHLQTNFKKTQMAIVPRGKQSRKRLRSYGGQFTIHKGEPMRLQTQIKYLGSIIDVNGSNKAAVIERIKLARASHVRLTPGIFQSRTYTTGSKTQLYKTHEATVLTSGLDIRVLNKGENDMLERHQMRSLRHITKSPAHTQRETNNAIRQRLGVPTVESQMRVQRLGFYREVCKRPHLNRQVIAALYGHSVWDPHEPTIRTLPHMKQLHNDIKALWQANHRETNAAEPTTWSNTTVCIHMQAYLLSQNKSDIKRLLTYISEREQDRAQKKKQPRQQPEDGEGVACDICMSKMVDSHALAAHKWAKHRVMNPLRQQVATATCPGCSKQFSNVVNARSHWVKQICIHNNTAHSTTQQIETARHNATVAEEANTQQVRRGPNRPATPSVNSHNRIVERAIAVGASDRVVRTLDEYFRLV